MTGAIGERPGRQEQLSPQLRDALARAILPPTKHGPGPLQVELPGLGPLLQPALRALDMHGYALQITRTRTLRAICQGALALGKPPVSWDNGEWLHVRRSFGRTESLALMLAAVRGYEVPSPQQLHPLFRVCSSVPLARRLFGHDAVQREYLRLRDAMACLGYRDTGSAYTLPGCVAELLVWHGKPTLDAASDESMARFASDSPSQKAYGALHGVSAGLVQLGILRDCIPQRRSRMRNGTAAEGCPPEWLSWINRWQAQSDLAPAGLASTRSALVAAGRWLAIAYPGITSPSEWTLETARQWVRHVSERRSGDNVPQGISVPHPGKPQAATSKAKLVGATRTLFRDLVDWEWIERRFDPFRAFRLPRQIQRAIAPNPRPLDDAVWLKLRAAALTLKPDDLPRGGRGRRSLLPLAMMRAVTAAWVFSGCRSDEICRLAMDCTYVEDVPEQEDAQTGEVVPAFRQPMLRVPANKTQGEFVKPVEAPLVEAIEQWRRERPKQPKCLDRITRQPTDYLFSHRGRALGRGCINRTVIPTLLRKAGLPASDSRGAITSHRARTTLATKLYSPASGMAAVEVMRWLGHTDLSTGRWYIDLTPVRLMTAFHRSVRMSEALRFVGVLADTRPGPGDPVLRYDLGQGWCTNPAYAMCAHRMACARCSFYEPAEAMRDKLEQQAGRFQHMLQELHLADDERAAVEGDADAVKLLLLRLTEQPTPDKTSKN